MHLRAVCVYEFFDFVYRMQPHSQRIIWQTSNERRWIYYSLCFVKPIIENAFEHANLCAISSTNCLYNYRVVIDEFVVSRSHTDSNTACRYGTFITQLRKWTWCVAIDIILVSCVRHMISADCFFFQVSDAGHYAPWTKWKRHHLSCSHNLLSEKYDRISRTLMLKIKRGFLICVLQKIV